MLSFNFPTFSLLELYGFIKCNNFIIFMYIAAQMRETIDSFRDQSMGRFPGVVGVLLMAVSYE